MVRWAASRRSTTGLATRPVDLAERQCLHVGPTGQELSTRVCSDNARLISEIELPAGRECGGAIAFELVIEKLGSFRRRHGLAHGPPLAHRHAGMSHEHRANLNRLDRHGSTNLPLVGPLRSSL